MRICDNPFHHRLPSTTFPSGRTWTHKNLVKSREKPLENGRGEEIKNACTRLLWFQLDVPYDALYLCPLSFAISFFGIEREMIVHWEKFSFSFRDDLRIAWKLSIDLDLYSKRTYCELKKTFINSNTFELKFAGINETLQFARFAL